jgi:hypothetical protein
MGIEFSRKDLTAAGFTEEEVSEYEKAQGESSFISKAGSNASRLAGVLVGTANAPLAFIKGAMNADIANPEEFKNMSFPGKMATQVAGGMESAFRSATKKGDWGEDYDTYYKARTGGRTLEQDFGTGGSMLLKMGLDLAMDPLFGPALALDLGKKGIRSIPEFARYLHKGTTPAGAELRALTEGLPVVNTAKLTEAELLEINTASDAERTAAVQRLRDTLSGRQADLLKAADDEAAAVYGYSTLHGTVPDDPGITTRLAKYQEAVREDKIAAEQIRSFEASLGDVDGPVVNMGVPKPGTYVPSLSAKPAGTEHLAGGVAGMDIDEEGNLTFDIKNGLLGMAAGVGAKGILAKSSAAKIESGMFRQVTSGAESESVAKVAAMYDKTVAARAAREALTWSKAKDFLIRGFVDQSGNLKREAMAVDPLFGHEMVIQQELHAGSSAIASNMNEQYQRAIFRGLSSNEQELLNSVIQSKRIIAIDEYKGLGAVKHPDGLTGVEHIDFLTEMEKKLPRGVYADLEARANLYFDAMQEQLGYRLKEGLINQDQYAELSKHIYSPRQFMQHLDDSMTAVRGGKKISVSERGDIKALDEGSIELLENNAQRLLQYNVNMTQDMISRNKANKTLLDFVEANPGNGIAMEAKIVGATKAGAPIYADTPAGHELVRLFVDGKERLLHMPEDMAKGWITADPLMNHTLSTIVQWLTGTKLVKAFATGYNPAFALSNIPRDVALVWGTTDQYSKHLPIAFGQLARDFAAVAGDVMKRTGRVLDYVNEGGGTELLTYYGRLSQAGEIGEKVNTLGKVLGWVGETSEIWTRIALRERAMRNGLSPREATWQARHYLDFSQGGNIAKAFDNAMPYLNAGIQGTRSIFRYAAAEPGQFAYKMGQLGAVSMGLYMANYMTNRETWEAISDRDKEANFIITTPFSYTDKEGQLRRYYVKIPKDQGQRAFCTLFEGLMEAYYEEKVPGKRMAMALGEFVGMGSMPPALSALLAYAGNKDSWNWQDVWRGPKDIEPGEEYTADTHPLAVAAGQITNLSPERGSKALGAIMPPNNAWVGLVGGGLRAITDSFNPKMETETLEQMLMSNPSIRRFLSATSEINRYRSDIDQAKTEEVTRRFKQARDLDKLTTAYFQNKDQGVRDKIYDYIENAPAEDQDRLTKRVMRHSQTAQLPDGSWWRSVGGLPTPARAAAFIKRFESESPVGQSRMLELADKVPGFTSDGFIEAAVALKRQ